MGILDMERIDNWIEELKSTQEHENYDNNIDPMQEKIDEGRTNDDNIGTYNNVRNIPMETAYNMSDVEKFVRFENRSGENNCQSNLLKRIEEDSRIFGDSTDLKLKKLGKVLEDTREVSMQEVIFRLFGYSMCCSSRKKKFIQTLPPEKRDGLIKSNIEELDDKDDIFAYNIIDYYQNRPDQLEDVSLASFAANYEYFKHNTNTIQIQDDNIEEDDNNEDEENITEQKLPLKNNMGYLKERKKKSIIRYFKGKYDDDIKRIRCVMLLFHPFRNEVEEVHNNDKILEKYNECKERVEREQSLFEPHPEFLEFVENLEQEIIEEDEQHQEELDNEFVEEDTTKAEELQDWFK